MQKYLSYLPPVATVGEVVDILQSCKHQSIPLVTGTRVEEGKRLFALEGSISRHALLSLLRYRQELLMEDEVSHLICYCCCCCNNKM